MEVRFECPVCGIPVCHPLDQDTNSVDCPACEWNRPIPIDRLSENGPRQCLACGCGDLWRQKDFPQALGLTMVGLGVLLSTIAWAMYLPEYAIGVLMGFALVDLLLYTFMPDMLVCYRCSARYRHADLGEDPRRFDLEVAERYRQESIRLEESIAAKGAASNATDADHATKSP